MASQAESVGARSVRTSPEVGLKRRKHTIRNVVIGVVAIAAVTAALAFVPVAHSFSRTLSSSSSADGIQAFTFPKNSQVSGTWSSSNGVAVTLTVFDSSGSIIDEGNASSGQFAFQANGSSYEFDVSSLSPVTTTISGTYSAAILSTVTLY